MSRRIADWDGPRTGFTITDALKRVPVKINRNLMNFPLARDRRTKAEWFQGSRTRRWMADLPGEGRESHRIRLMLPAAAHAFERRCPTALDMNVLFQLLAEAQRQDGARQIEFASLAVLLRRLGLTERNRERRRLEECLFYWTQLSIRWSRWYQNRDHVELTLPPPVKDAVWKGNRITIILDPDWFRLARSTGYYEWLPLPLPPQAAAQNLVLLVLTQNLGVGNLEPALAEFDGYFDRLAPSTKGMDRWWLARKMGLLHKQRNAVLNRAANQAAEWFSNHGGKLEQVTVPIDDEEIALGQIAFRYAKPRVPRWPRRRLLSFMGRSHGPPQAPFRNSAVREYATIRDQDDVLDACIATALEMRGRKNGRGP